MKMGDEKTTQNTMKIKLKMMKTTEFREVQ